MLLQSLGFICTIFLPGFFILKSRKTFERFVFAPVVSVLLNMVLVQAHNIIFGISLKLFPVTLIISNVVIIYIFRKDSLKIKLNKSDFYILFFFVLSLSLNLVYLAKTNFQLTGSDVSQYGILTHSWYLKDSITSDLRPYIESGNFFPNYPAVLFTFLALETFIFEPLHAMVWTTMVLVSLCAPVFYKLSESFLNQKKALYSTVFFLFLFNIPFSFVVGRGILSFAIGFFPLLCSLYLFSNLPEKKGFDWLLVVSLIVLAMTHYIHMVLVLFFGISVLIYSWKRRTNVKFLKTFVISFLLFLMLILPMLLKFPLGSSNNYIQIIAEFRNLQGGFYDSLYALFFADGALPVSNIFYFLGLVVTVLLFNRFQEKKKIILYFILLSLFLSVSSINLLFINRLSPIPKIMYPISFSLLFDNPYLATLMVGYSFMNPGNPGWVIINEHTDPFYRVVSLDELRAFEYIKWNTPENSTFLIDGFGGLHHGSHGDRIFIMTSRRIFFYDMFMNQSEYEKRLDLFGQIAINPEDEDVLDELKNYGVSHIYIGPGDIILKPELFSDSDYYNLIWIDGDVHVFEIL